MIGTVVNNPHNATLDRTYSTPFHCDSPEKSFTMISSEMPPNEQVSRLLSGVQLKANPDEW